MREHFTRISATEHTHQHPDCGCQLVRGEHGDVSFYQCPKHDAALDLLAACNSLLNLIDLNFEESEPDNIRNESEYVAARAAIAKATGGA